MHAIGHREGGWRWPDHRIAGQAMVRFRFFVLDVLGRIDRGFERDCRNEAEAMVVARKLAGTDTVEIWRDRRLVARLAGR